MLSIKKYNIRMYIEYHERCYSLTPCPWNCVAVGKSIDQRTHSIDTLRVSSVDIEVFLFECFGQYMVVREMDGSAPCHTVCGTPRPSSLPFSENSGCARGDDRAD